MDGVAAAHTAEISVGFQDGVGVVEIESRHEFQPGEGVEQTAAEQSWAQVGLRQVFVEQKQVVAEIQICFAGIRCRKAASAQVVDTALRHGHYSAAVQMYAPAQVDFLHVGEKAAVEPSYTLIKLSAHHQRRPCCPKDGYDGIILPFVVFDR